MWLIGTLIAFAGAVLMHGLAVRLPLRADAVMRFLLVGAPIGLTIAAWLLLVYGVALPALAAILLYAFLCELYIFLFTLVLSSVSAATLERLRANPGVASAEQEDPVGMVTMRLERLVKNGFVARDGTRLVLTDKGQRFHRTFISLRRFFRHPAL